MRGLSKILICTFLLVLVVSSLIAQEKPAKAELPVLLTSCGQSPGPIRLKVFLQRLKYDFDYIALGTIEDLAAKKEAGTPYKTIIIVTGASLKGMGAAGISLKDELERTTELIEEAKKQGIKIIGAHIEGMERRAQGASPGDTSDEQSIDIVCPNSDILLIHKEGDEDRRFTIISENSKIPMVVFEKNMEIPTVLKSIFEK